MSFIDFFVNKAIVNNYNRIYIEAEGGFGKTTSLKLLCKKIVLNYNQYNIIPLYVDCNSVRDSVQKTIAHKFCKVTINELENSNIDFLIDSTLSNSQYRFLLIFDGLNEVNEVISKKITDFIFNYINNENIFIIVSSRYDSSEYHRELSSFYKLSFLSIDDGIVENYVNNYVSKPYSSELLTLLRKPMMLSLFLSSKEKSKYANIENRSQLLNIFFAEEKSSIWNETGAIPKRYSKHSRNTKKIFDYILDVFLPVLCSSGKYLFSEEEIYNIYHSLKKNIVFKNTIINERYNEILYDKCAFWEILIDHLKILNPELGKYKIHQIYVDFFCAKYYQQAFVQNINIFENNISNEVRCSIGELLGEYKFKNKSNLDSPMSPIEEYLQKNKNELSSGCISNLIEIMKVSRDNKITADYSDLNLKETSFIDTEVQNSSFENTLLSINSFVICPFNEYIDCAVVSNNNKFVLFLFRNIIKIYDNFYKKIVKVYKLNDIVINYISDKTDDKNYKSLIQVPHDTPQSDFNIEKYNYEKNEHVCFDLKTGRFGTYFLFSVNAIKDDSFLIEIFANNEMMYFSCSVNSIDRVEQQDLLSYYINSSPIHVHGDILVPVKKDAIKVNLSDSVNGELNITYKGRNIRLKTSLFSVISSITYSCNILTIVDDSITYFVNIESGNVETLHTSLEPVGNSIIQKSKIYQCFNDGYLRAFNSTEKLIETVIKIPFTVESVSYLEDYIVIIGRNEFLLINSNDNSVFKHYELRIIDSSIKLNDKIIVVQGLFGDLILIMDDNSIKDFSVNENPNYNSAYRYQNDLNCVTFMSENSYNILKINNKEFVREKYSFGDKNKFKLCKLVNENLVERRKFVSERYIITPLYLYDNRKFVAGYAPYYSDNECKKALYILELFDNSVELIYFKEIYDTVGIFDDAKIYFKDDLMNAVFLSDNSVVFKISVKTLEEDIAVNVDEKSLYKIIPGEHRKNDNKNEEQNDILEVTKLASCNICGCKMKNVKFCETEFKQQGKEILNYNGAIVD